MELNAEQIIKALELCTTTDDCVGCPYLIRRGDGAILPCTIDADALALIKQLTEENERMRAEAEKLRKENIELNLKNQLLYDEGKTWYAEYHKTKEDLKQEKMYKRASEKLADKYCAELQTSKADTVREMQETFKEEVRKYADVICTEDAEWLIDQIAKEMLEGDGD